MLSFKEFLREHYLVEKKLTNKETSEIYFRELYNLIIGGLDTTNEKENLKYSYPNANTPEVSVLSDESITVSDAYTYAIELLDKDDKMTVSDVYDLVNSRGKPKKLTIVRDGKEVTILTGYAIKVGEKLIKMGQINKSIITTPTLANKGEVSEGILAVACFLKLTKAVKRGVFADIGIAEVQSFIKKKFAGKTITESKHLMEEVFNKTVTNDKVDVDFDGTKDNFVLNVKLKESAGKTFIDDGKFSLLKNEYNSAIKFANSDYFINKIKSNKEILKKDKTPNEIKITSDGVSDEKGTKIDVNFAINGQKINTQISLKTGSTNTLEQSGTSADSVKTLFHNFGVDIKKLKLKDENGKAINNIDIEHYLDNKKTPELFTALFESVANYFNKTKLKGNNTNTEIDFLNENLLPGLKHIAIKNDPSVIIVHMNAGDFKPLKVTDGLKEELDSHDLKAAMKLDAKRPVLAIYGVKKGKSDEVTNKNLIIQFRLEVRKHPKFKGSSAIEVFDGDNPTHYIKNIIVEKGKLFVELTHDK